MNLIPLAQTASTNRYLMQLCNEKPSTPAFTTVVCRHQTAGHGQRGTGWEAEADKNLTFSFVIYPTFLQVRRQFILSQITCLAVKELLARFTSDVSVKWPNDVYWQDKKICGILIEHILSGNRLERSIVGVGLNVNQEVFRSDAPNPVSLKQITGKEFDCGRLLEQIMERIERDYAGLPQNEEEIARRYAHSLFRGEGFHTYRDANGTFTARLLGVEPDGRLLLEEREGNTRSYYFKEVQYLPE
ncbi:MAG: biotin--[acetyl-CoA-carboxylase] ligase [Prevotellaceae bacterium]|jgi:BirA family biotin operon repressor/biotin-[acetyl-CoA-carboxylase] ligase|nr:biotin--[acetyl-CoA-carboxylase] ligase [Prevotellaceae bacterium]